MKERDALTDTITKSGEAVIVELPRRTGRVGKISQHLRHAIETGAYSEGDRLPAERELADAFDAARSTVRRALDQLEKAGLVSRRLGSGTYVGPGQNDPDLADGISPLQLIEARLAVEPFTARLAVLHATKRSLEDMEAVLAQAEASGSDKDSFTHWDSEFHLLIARASANPLLINVYRQINQVRLHAQWNAQKEKILTPDVIDDYNRQHRGIYDAINERDAQAAQNLITEHLEKARDDLLRADSR